MCFSLSIVNYDLKWRHDLECHLLISDDPRSFIYDHNMFIMQGTVGLAFLGGTHFLKIEDVLVKNS